MKFQYIFIGIIALLIVHFLIFQFFPMRRLESSYKGGFQQFRSKHERNKKVHICVLVALKNDLIYNAISSLEMNRNISYDYTLILGHDSDDFEIAVEIKQMTNKINVNHFVLSVHNPLKKPGPVFNALSLRAYEYGCDYMYRINDDTEIIGNEWSYRFIDTLLSFKPPNVGVVGPTCHEGNTEILTHDFVHRSHLEIFQEHYPANLTDWWLDDWITRVYGPDRSAKLPDVKVIHHLQTTRYAVTFSNEQVLPVILAQSKTVLAKYLGLDNEEFIENVLYRKKIQITLHNMSSPVFVSFVNEGFKAMTANFLCNLQHVMPHVLTNHLILIVESKTTAQWILEFDSRIAIYVFESNNPITSNVSSYGTYDYKAIMMTRGYALLHFLGQGVPIVWLEPDALYYDDLTSLEEIVAPKTDFVFYDDYSMPCGCFIVFPGHEGSVNFYKRVLEQATAIYDKNDQVSIDSIKNSVSWGMLDKCKFRSGAYVVNTLPNGQGRLTDCDHVKAIVQHLNFIVGLDQKIALAQRLNGWFVDSDLHCKAREIKAVVLTMDRDKSLKRLVDSLANSEASEIDLHFSVDVDNNNQQNNKVISYIDEVKQTWSKGFVTSRVWREQAGILKNWIEAWPAENYLEDQYKAVILLEDDLEVSPVFHHWFVGAHKVYGGLHGNGKSVGAITGQRPQLIADLDHMHESMNDKVPQNVKLFAYKLMATWSLSPRVKVWSDFRQWYKSLPNNFNPVIPNARLVVNDWYNQFVREGRQHSMWEIYYIYYSTFVDLQYTLYAWANGGSKTFVCNWREKGLHFDGSQSATSDFPLVKEWDPAMLGNYSLHFVDWDAKF